MSMIPNDWVAVAFIMIKEHQKAMFGDAEAGRIEAEIPADGMSRFAAVRRQIGAAMVHAGERMQGVQRPEAAADLPRGSSLHSAR